MFERLVVSTSQRRQGRTLKFFVCTSFVYLALVGVALALSVLLATPKLADTSIARPGPFVFHWESTGPKANQPKTVQAASTTDLRNVERLENIIRTVGHPQPAAVQPVPPGTRVVDESDLPPGDGRPGPPGMPPSTWRDTSSGGESNDPPRPPDIPRPQPRASDTAKPLSISSRVLQGKAIDRAVPIYPEIPRIIRLQGDVSVEVIISPEGRVESVRVVSGHPLLVQSAMDAARRWRFEATYLNGVPVRVTGVITFVFKINE